MAMASARVSADAADGASDKAARETAASQRLRCRMIISYPQLPDGLNIHPYDRRFRRKPVELTLRIIHPGLTIVFPGEPVQPDG